MSAVVPTEDELAALAARVGALEAKTGPTVPPQAAAAGFTTLAFADEFTSLDIAYGANTGQRWNAGLWYEPVDDPSHFSIVAGTELLMSGASNLTTWHHDGKAGRAFVLGYFEARMKGNNWSSFWLFSAHHTMGLPITGDPLTFTAEIDAVETDSTKPNAYFTTLHLNTASPNGGPQDQINQPNYYNAQGPIIDAWHTYGVLWEAGKITWFLDDKPVNSAPAFASTAQPLYVLLGIAPGGPMGGAPTDPVSNCFDWVRVWTR